MGGTNVYEFFPSASGNPFEVTVSVEEVSCLEKKQPPTPRPSTVPSWQKNSTLLPEDQDMLPSETACPTSLVHLWNQI